MKQITDFGYSFNLFKAYALQLKMLVDELRDLEFG